MANAIQKAPEVDYSPTPTHQLSTRQLNIMWIGMSVALSLGLCPPFKGFGYCPLLYGLPEHSVDFPLVIGELIILWALTRCAVVTAAGGNNHPEAGRKFPIMCWLGLAVAIGFSIFAHYVCWSYDHDKQVAETKAASEQLKVNEEAEKELAQKQEQEHRLAQTLTQPKYWAETPLLLASSVYGDTTKYLALETAMVDDNTVSYKLTCNSAFVENITISLDNKDGFSILKRSFLYHGGCHTGTFSCSPSIYQSVAAWHVEAGLNGNMENSL